MNAEILLITASAQSRDRAPHLSFFRQDRVMTPEDCVLEGSDDLWREQPCSFALRTPYIQLPRLVGTFSFCEQL